MTTTNNTEDASSDSPTLIGGEGRQHAKRITVAAGCFWGVEATFRQVEGVVETSVGYEGGHETDPTYEAVCGHRTGHAEAVEVWFDPHRVSYSQLLETFWHSHNPTTRNRQGFNVGGQYRSAIFVHDAGQEASAKAGRDHEQRSRRKKIVTEIVPASTFYRAEEYHQHYMEKHGRTARASTLDREAETGR